MDTDIKSIVYFYVRVLAVVALIYFFAHVCQAEEGLLLKVAVIDTGLATTQREHVCSTGHYDFTLNKPEIGPDDYTPGHGYHGTFVVKAIELAIKQRIYATGADYCFLIYKIDGSGEQSAKAIRYALNQGVTLFNLSYGGLTSNKAERVAIASSPKAMFIVAAGNDGANLNKRCVYYPACYGFNNIIIIGSTHPKSNKGRIVRAVLKSPHGSSEAAAFFTGRMIAEFVKIKRNMGF